MKNSSLLSLSTLFITLIVLASSAPAQVDRSDVKEVWKNLKSATSPRYASPTEVRNMIRIERHTSPVSMKKMVTKQKKKKTLEPKGFTFDPCKYHKDCIRPLLCVDANMEKACSGTENCFCLGERTQLCNKCRECKRYPKESCLRLPGEKTSDGVCASLFTVYEGILEEIGCNTLKRLNITPRPVQ